jgi:hypothetical protein
MATMQDMAKDDGDRQQMRWCSLHTAPSLSIFPHLFAAIDGTIIGICYDIVDYVC